MGTIPLAVPALAALVAGLALQPLVLRVMTVARVMDTPSARSSHSVPIPRGGGVAVAVAALAGIALYPPAHPMLLPLLLFAGIGLWEDLRGVAPSRRLAAQLAAGVLTGAVLLAGHPAVPAGALPVAALALATLVIALWLATYVNAFNFMDGINGISGVHAALTGAIYAVVGVRYGLPVLVVSGTVAAAAAVTFLPWNAGRARIFLGDVGSYGLGGLLAGSAAFGLLYGAPALVVAAPLALYLIDTGWTLVRRCASGEAWLRPHRGHTYQRLTDRGWSHQRVTAFTAATSAAICACALVAVDGSAMARAAATAVALIIFTGYLTAPSLLPTSTANTRERSRHA